MDEAVPVPKIRCITNPSPPNNPARSRFLNASPTRTPRVPPRNAPRWQMSVPPTLARSTAMIFPGDGAAKATRSGRPVLFVNTDVKKFSPVNDRLKPAARRPKKLESIAVAHARVHVDTVVGEHHGARLADERITGSER